MFRERIRGAMRGKTQDLHEHGRDPAETSMVERRPPLDSAFEMPPPSPKEMSDGHVDARELPVDE